MADTPPGVGPNNPLYVNIQSIQGGDFEEDWRTLIRTVEDGNDKLDQLTAAIMGQNVVPPPQGLSGHHSLAESGDPSQSGEGGASTPPNTPESQARQGAGMESRIWSMMGGVAERLPGTDLSSGYGPPGMGSSGASRPPGAGPPGGGGPAGDPMSRFLDQYHSQNSTNMFTDPRMWGGQFTAQQMLTNVGQFMTEGHADAYRAWMQGGQQGPPPPGNARTVMGSGALLAGQYGAPAVGAAQQYLQRAGNFAQQTQDYGELLGTSAGTSSSLAGFRVPFTGASFRGLEQGLSDKVQGIFAGGISGEQIGMIRSGLAEAGWTPETARTGQIQGGFQKTFQYDQGTAKSVLQSDLWDKALREGATSTDNFFSSIRNLRDIANTAKVSVDTLVQSMDEYGQANQAMGGTHFQGQQLATTVAGMGFAPSEFSGLVHNNPWTDSSVFRQSGVTPWTQGAMNQGQRLSMALGGFQQAASMFPQTPISTPIAGAIDQQTGKPISNTISGAANASAQMGLIPGMDQIPPEVRQKLIKDPNLIPGIQSALSLSQSTDMWTGQIVGHDNMKLLGSNVRGGFDWGDLQAQLKSAVNPQTGNAMFSSKDIQSLNQAADPEDIAGWKKQGLSDTDIAKKVAQERSGKIHSMLDSKMGSADDSVQAGDFTIELGPAAKKALHISTSPQGQAKLNALAGSGTTNAPYGSGPSTIPFAQDGYMSGGQ